MPELSELPPRQALIGGWSLQRYIDVLRWWVIGGGIVLVLAVFFQVKQTPIVVVEIILFLTVGVITSRKRAGRIEALTAGALAGACVGAMVAISRFVATPSGLLAVNLISETLLTGLAGTLLTVSGYLLHSRILKK